MPNHITTTGNKYENNALLRDILDEECMLDVPDDVTLYRMLVLSCGMGWRLLSSLLRGGTGCKTSGTTSGGTCSVGYIPEPESSSESGSVSPIPSPEPLPDP